MSYAKMMKWNRRHPKGTKQWMGFNPSGITAEECDERERKFVEEWRTKTPEQRQEYWDNIKQLMAMRLGSFDWTWCAFERAFCFRGELTEKPKNYQFKLF